MDDYPTLVAQAAEDLAREWMLDEVGAMMEQLYKDVPPDARWVTQFWGGSRVLQVPGREEKGYPCSWLVRGE